tara:strand:- start:66 stop:749 length:684 start_codon:yes stop_codon:yes gene_type:complete
MSLSNHKFNYEINLLDHEIYSATLKAIEVLDYKLISTDEKNKIINAKIKMTYEHAKISLKIKIQNKSIEIETGMNQLSVSELCREKSEILVMKIQEILEIPEKIILKNETDYSDALKKDGSVQKKVWLIVAAIIIVPLIIGIIYSSNESGSNSFSADEQKIREYIKQRAEMKEACDGMWYLRDLAGSMSDQEIINQCRPMGYDVYSKSWKYEPEGVKEVLRQYGIYD